MSKSDQGVGQLCDCVNGLSGVFTQSSSFSPTTCANLALHLDAVRVCSHSIELPTAVVHKLMQLPVNGSRGNAVSFEERLA